MKTPKSIWIINHYASSPETGMGGRSFYIAKELHKLGYNVKLIVASFNHKLHSPRRFEEPYEIDKTYGFYIVRIKVKHYSNSFNKKRILNWFIFGFRLIKHSLKFGCAPDVILCSSPSLLAFLPAKKLASRYKAKLVFEVRDIWPLTLVELGGYSPSHPFIRFLQWIEDKAYKDADLVLSNLPFSWEHMVSRGMDKRKFEWIPNGFNIDEVQNKKPLPPGIIEQIPKGKFIIGYTGAIGISNALDTLIDAANLLKEDDSVVFVLVGGGKEKSNLKARVDYFGLNNVIFVDPVKKTQIQSMLNLFDVCFIGWKDDPIYQFGISPNKLPDYFLSGRPVIHSFSGKGDMVLKAKAGITIPAENSVAIRDAVLKLKEMPSKERDELGKNGYKYAKENLGYEKLAQKLSLVFEQRLS